MARQSYAMVLRWQFLATFLRPVFPASRVQHVSDLHSKFTLECGPMPNVMVGLRIQVVPSVQRRKVWLTPTTGVPCINAAKTRNPLKFAGVPQTNETISAASGPKFTIFWGHVEEILLLNKFFSDCRYVP